MAIQWNKLALCLLTCLAFSAHAKSSDMVPPAAEKALQKEVATNAQSTTRSATSEAKSAMPDSANQKVAPKSREEKIKAMVEENQVKTKKLKDEMLSTKAKDKILASNCQSAKSRLQNLMTTPRVKMKNANGETYYLSPKEKNTQLKETREAIKRYCAHEE